ncbi:DUF3048 domain-containing protein [Rossellomorea aquimaris]|jgi:Protein of unknown function (DUF3048) N-terminal domain/Protein of unknown function (DUF3048) C-terminal domain|uniref:Lipoprotein YerB n=1 Tax=Rossellomorea aquimaris TaxID=189382 RepID=A0A1J6W0T7_9BACI|nr:DUF3048 domain-containing protein [Rossellomorea aquimaris]OIU70220.1 lipoprotein YerB [Rossellomorea aquimaris]
MLKKPLIILLSALTLAACSSDKEAGKKPAKEETAPVANENVENVMKFQSPLTGEEMKEESTDRAVAVMVNNHPKARPQSGLSKADIVYELLAEGDVTRFLAIFQSRQPDRIGPVRSARDYYIDLAKGYDSLYLAHGYSPDAKAMLVSGEIDHLNGIRYDGTLFKRAEFRKAPHNSYISFENIKKGAKENGFSMKTPPEPLRFASKDASVDGEDAESIMISYFNNPLFDVVYEYKEDEGKYERYSNGEQTVDYETEDPVLLENILIAEAPHKIIDSAGRRDIDLESGGNAYLLQDGKLREVKWENTDGRILPYEDGKQVPLRKGATWINIIPDSPGLSGSVSYQQ